MKTTPQRYTGTDLVAQHNDRLLQTQNSLQQENQLSLTDHAHGSATACHRIDSLMATRPAILPTYQYTHSVALIKAYLISALH